MTLWRDQLAGFVGTCSNYPRVSVVTTCRRSYQNAIWSSAQDRHFVYVHGFGQDSLEEAIPKYFNFFKLRADLTFAAIEQFKHPLYLRIYCQSQNPERQSEKEVFVGAQQLFGVFSEFLKAENRAFSDRINKPEALKLLHASLLRFAETLWDRNSRGLGLLDAISTIDQKQPESVELNRSLTKALQDQDLLV